MKALLRWAVYGFGAMFVGFCVLLLIFEEPIDMPVPEPASASAPPKPPACSGQDTLAYVMTQDAVRSRLKSPRSADFPALPLKVVEHPGCLYDVVAYVDATNGFGASLRRRYVAAIRAFDDGTWQVQELQVIE